MSVHIARDRLEIAGCGKSEDDGPAAARLAAAVQGFLDRSSTDLQDSWH